MSFCFRFSTFNDSFNLVETVRNFCASSRTCSKPSRKLEGVILLIMGLGKSWLTFCSILGDRCAFAPPNLGEGKIETDNSQRSYSRAEPLATTLPCKKICLLPSYFLKAVLSLVIAWQKGQCPSG